MTAASLSGHGALCNTHFALKAATPGRGAFTATAYATEFTLAAHLSGHGVISEFVPSPLELVFFPISGYFSAVAGTTAAAQPVSAIVTFTPRLAKDQLIYVDDAVLTLRPLVAVIDNGVLCTASRIPDIVDQDHDGGYVRGFSLPANMPEFNLVGAASSDGQGNLIYDVSFSVVTFDKANQSLAPFAFVAPTDATPVCLTNADFEALPWQPPNQAQWTPPLRLVGGRDCSIRNRWAVA